MKKLSTVLISLWMIFGSLIAQAQQTTLTPNLKFGEPTLEEMKINSCPYDSSAKAMVLCHLTDVSYVYLAGKFHLEYNIKKRIKILDAEGTDVANISILYESPEGSGGSRESLRGIKAFAYNLVNGKVVKTKMDSKLIFDEQVDKRHRLTKFTIPQAKAGTVIEYQYIKSSDFYYQIDDWYAQESIPTLYTALTLEVPGMFVFNVEQSGAQSLQSSKTDGTRAYVTGTDNEMTYTYNFKGINMRALKGDQFVWSPLTYASKVSFELRNISIPGVLYKDFTTSWEDIDKILMDDDDFGDRIKRANPLKEEMQAARIDTISDFRRKIAATYLLLHKKVKWDGTYALTGNRSRNVLKEGKASNADINFLLMNMLKSLDIKTAPIVLRTRNRGILPLSHPSLEALNTFVVGIYENDSTIHVMDGSAEKGYVDVLPPVLLTKGHIVNGGTFDIMKTAASRKMDVVKATLKKDGTLEGNVKFTYNGVCSLRRKNSIAAAKDSTDFVKKMEKELSLSVLRYGNKGVKEFNPTMQESVNFQKTLGGGDVLYLRPVLVKPFGEVPFTATQRDMPVEFDSPIMETYNAMIKIPEGYDIEELPQPRILRSPDRLISLHVQFSFEDGFLTAIYTLQIKKTLFFQDEYPGLKRFFEDVNHVLESVVVFKKK